MRSKKAIKNIIASLILQIVTLICGLIVPKLIIKSFGSNVNGLVSSITQFLAYITLLEVGIGPVIKAALYSPIAKKDKKQIEDILRSSEKFCRTIVLIFFIYLIVLSIIYPLIVNTEFSYIYTVSIILIISISIIAEYYFGMTYRLYLQAKQKNYINATIQILGYILNTIAIVALVNLNTSIQVVKLVSGMIFIIRPLLQNLYVKKKYKIDLKNADENYQLKQKWNGLAQHVATVVHSNTDIIVLTIFTPITEVSVYSVYYLVMKGVKSIIQAFTGGIDASFGDMIAKREYNQLSKSFKAYELFYHTITTMVYTCTMFLIIPFVTIYTFEITDADYVRPTFAILIVLAEFVWAVRQPYNELIKAAGHFKQTMKGAWVEAITNIVISLILVIRLGMIGVAIGTLIAMAIRCIELIYYTSKYILERNILYSFIRIGIISVQVIIVAIISTCIPEFIGLNYLDWIKYAIVVFGVSTLIIIPINLLIYKKDTKILFKMAKSIFLKRREKNETY